MYGRDYIEIPSDGGINGPYTYASQDDSVKSRLPIVRNWTNSQAGVVKMMKKPGALVLKASLPGVHREDVRLDLREEDGESILNLTVEKEEEHQSADRFGGSFCRLATFKIVRTVPLGCKVVVDDIKADLESDNLVVEVKMPFSLSGHQELSSRLDVHDNTSQKSVTSFQNDSSKSKTLDSRQDGF